MKYGNPPNRGIKKPTQIFPQITMCGVPKEKPLSLSAATGIDVNLRDQIPQFTRVLDRKSCL